MRRHHTAPNTDSEHRVLYVLDRYPTVSQTFVRNEIHELRHQGWQVDVLSLSPGDFPVDEPVSYLQQVTWARWLPDVIWWATHHPLRMLRVLRVGVALRGEHLRTVHHSLLSALREHAGSPPDRVHAHFLWGASAVAIFAGALLGAPTSVTGHARDIYVDGQHLQAKLRALNLLVTVCDFNVSWLRERSFILPRTAVVRCGVVLPPWPDDPTAGRDIDVVSVARLIPKKGLDLLISAVAQLPPEERPGRVVLVGDGEERGALESLVQASGLDHIVELVGDRSHGEVLELISRARVFALPCRLAPDGDSDAFPVVLWEALSRGAAVMTTPIAGIAEVIDLTTGWLVPVDDVAALAASLHEALSDDGQRSQRAAAGRSRAEVMGSLRTEVTVLARLLEDISDAPVVRPPHPEGVAR